MKYERKNKIMSKCPEELKGLLNIFGIDPESVEVHAFGVETPDEMRFRKNRFENITTEAKKRAETASYNDAVAYLKHLGLSDEKIAEIMQEVKENKRKMTDFEGNDVIGIRGISIENKTIEYYPIGVLADHEKLMKNNRYSKHVSVLMI